MGVALRPSIPAQERQAKVEVKIMRMVGEEAWIASTGAGEIYVATALLKCWVHAVQKCLAVPKVVPVQLPRVGNKRTKDMALHSKKH